MTETASAATQPQLGGPKPCMGYPSQSAAVRALHIQGHRPAAIAAMLAISGNSVNRAICEFRKSKAPSIDRPSSWSEKDRETLKRLWLEGKTTYEIVAAIRGRHSRGAVCGIIHRSGLSRTGKRPQPKPEPVKKPIVLAPPAKSAKPDDDGLSWSYIDCPQDPIWETGEERRRAAFTRRAAEGARKALETAQP